MTLLTGPLQPAWLLGKLYARFFERLPVPEAWVQAVRAATLRGTVVHVVRNVSLVDLLAIDHLTRRFDLPRIGFANELGAWLGPERLRGSSAERLAETLRRGESAVLFMKRPPSVLSRVGSATHRGRSEGDDLMRVILSLHRATGISIVMVPETLVWTQRPDRLGFSVVDTIFGSADFPGEIRAAGQLLVNHAHCVIRAGEPAVLGDLLSEENIADDLHAARRVTYAMLRKVERERRAVLGPAQKPADRVREEVLRSPKLQRALRDLAGPGEEERVRLEDKARTMLRGMQAAPDPGALRGLELVADTLVDRVYEGIEVDEEGIDRVRAAARTGSIVLLPSHKSHVDYLLLSYVLRKHGLALPLIAAGDNLSFFPIGALFRRSGAFFIRRSFKGDRLYTHVVDAYVRRLIKEGHALELFLEGGRSRTGKLLEPKLGLLNMIVDAALGAETRAISFVPVSIGYERMMEEGAYARELSGATKKREDAAALLKVGAVLRERYGRANVQIGRIVTLDELRAEIGVAKGAPMSPAKRRAIVTRLAYTMMSEINRVTAVTPGALVATTLLCHGRRGISHLDLVAHVKRLHALTRRLGARATPSLVRSSGALREDAIRDAARVYVRGDLIKQHVPGDTLTGEQKKRARDYDGDDVIYTVPDNTRIVLDIAKNMIVHLFVDRALVSVALLAPHAGGGPPIPRAELRERVLSLSRLFKIEFTFRADASFDQIFEETLRDMCEHGELALTGEGGALVGFGPGHSGLEGRGHVTFYAAVLRNFLESYRIAARALRALVKGPMSAKDLVAKALRIGEQMFLGAEIERAEAVSGPVIENAVAAFVEQGYLARREGKIELAESFASEEGARGIEAKVAGYLLRRAGESVL